MWKRGNRNTAGAEGGRNVTGIDLSPASIEMARSRISIAGLDENQVRFEVADAASVPLQAHQWVLLDRVICCHHDADTLLANASSATEVRLAFSAPESRGWRGALNEVAWGVENLWKAVSRRATCRGYVHDLKAIERLLGDAGFRRLREGRRRLWYAAVFERSTDNHHGGGQSDLGQSGPSSKSRRAASRRLENTQLGEGRFDLMLDGPRGASTASMSHLT